MRLSASSEDGLRLPRMTILAQPQTVASRWLRCAVVLGCLCIIVGVLVGEVATPEKVTFGGFSLLAVMLATWMVPLPYYAPVTLAALALPFVAQQLDGVDPITAKFQFASTATAAVLAFLTVRAIQRTQAERQRSHDLLLQFTANAAHELRSPLALMRATLEHMVRRPRTPEEYRDQATTVLSEVDRLIRVSNALLTLARSDAGALALEREAVHLAALVDAAVQRWQPLAAERQITLQAECSTTIPILCDPAMIGRVLDNLLENAIRHTPASGAVRLLAEPESGGASVLLSVIDTGEGIARELLPTLFERFSRGSARRRADGGTGLGLAVSAAVAAAHGGSIRCAASSSRGTTMVLDLPVTASSA